MPLPNVADNDRELLHSEIRGKLAIESLVSLAKRYRIDGVVLCRVHAFHPYKPPVLGLQSQLVSDPLGRHGLGRRRDLRLRASEKVQLDLRHYYETELSETESLHDWELLCLSPRMYGSYVVHRIVAHARATRLRLGSPGLAIWPSNAERPDSDEKPNRAALFWDLAGR